MPSFAVIDSCVLGFLSLDEFKLDRLRRRINGGGAQIDRTPQRLK
jgi:hypothetical protein